MSESPCNYCIWEEDYDICTHCYNYECFCGKELKGQPAILLINLFIADLEEYDKFLPLTCYPERAELKKIINKWKENIEKLR